MKEQDFIRDKSLEIVVEDLIENEPELIYLKAGKVGVVCLRSDKCKKKDGIPLFADCEEVPEKFKWATDAKFMITVYTPNISNFDSRRIRILLFQQLLKITPKEKEGEFKIRDYDVKDFSVIVNRYGAEWFRSPELFDGE
ncbi:MAG: hypothetical protein K5640_07005 [Treponema sp.]|nr:hypothetical protein [Treponema sp.]